MSKVVKRNLDGTEITKEKYYLVYVLLLYLY